MQPPAEEFKRRCRRIRNAAERGDMRQVRWERREMDLLLDAETGRASADGQQIAPHPSKPEKSEPLCRSADSGQVL